MKKYNFGLTLLLFGQFATAAPNCPPEDRPCPIVPEPDYDKPAQAPRGVRVQLMQNNEFSVSWVDTTGNEDSFLISGASALKKIVKSNSSETTGNVYSVTYRDLTPKRYCLRIAASNSSGSGPLSNQVCTLPWPSPFDRDRDGIIDSTENQLLERFAPQIWLHSTETSLPVSVEWMLSRSRLRFSHPYCPDHELLGWGEVTGDLLVSQSHRNVDAPPFCAPWNCCDHTGPQLKSYFYSSEPKKSFFLQLPDSAHSGSTERSDWVIYGHVYPASNGGIALQYWQLYAYNDSIQTFNHEGDWEYSAVLLDQNREPVRFAFFRHGRIAERRPEEIQLEGDHHTSYSAKGSHAQYANAHSEAILTETCDDESFSDGVQGDLIARDKCDKGISWPSWQGRVLNMGERHFGGVSWLRFSGLWGEIGAAAISVPIINNTPIAFTSGPPGPAFQDSRWKLWVSNELCDNLSDDDLDGQIDESSCSSLPLNNNRIQK